MAQGVLPFKYETGKKAAGMTAPGGLPAYLDLAHKIGISKSIHTHLKVRAGGQGWTDNEMVLALVLLHLAGGDCVDDIKVLEADDGFCYEQLRLPFATVGRKGIRYKVHGIVTNMDWDGEALIAWYHQGCGKSEQAHAVMKEDLAGGNLPSGAFGVNAAWWWIMILALNLNAMMKKMALGKGFQPRRMKAIRFSLIHLPGRVVYRSRCLIIRLTTHHPSLELLVGARRRIAMLKPLPYG